MPDIFKPAIQSALLLSLPYLAGTILILLPRLSPATEPTGFWLDTKRGGTVIELYRCDSGLCGDIIWLRRPYQDGRLKRDVNNPNPAARQQPLCGLQLLGGFEQVSADRWQDGWIYNPRNGQRYSARLQLLSDTKLRMRGFLALPIFGANRDWRRLDTPPGRCPPAAP